MFYNSIVRFTLKVNIIETVIIENKNALTVKEYAIVFSAQPLPNTLVMNVQLPH